MPDIREVVCATWEWEAELLTLAVADCSQSRGSSLTRLASGKFKTLKRMLIIMIRQYKTCTHGAVVQCEHAWFCVAVFMCHKYMNFHSFTVSENSFFKQETYHMLITMTEVIYTHRKSFSTKWKWSWTSFTPMIVGECLLSAGCFKKVFLPKIHAYFVLSTNKQKREKKKRAFIQCIVRREKKSPFPPPQSFCFHLFCVLSWF